MLAGHDDTLNGYLRQLYLQAGRPAMRSIASEIGRSRTWVSDVLRGRTRRPRWAGVQQLVAYLNGNEQVALSLWRTHVHEDQPQLKQRAGDQPLPAKVRGAQPIHELVMADILARARLGIQRYGTPLQAHNGRDALQDLYEELLDAAQYLKQVIEERNAKRGGGEDAATTTKNVSTSGARIDEATITARGPGEGISASVPNRILENAKHLVGVKPGDQDILARAFIKAILLTAVETLEQTVAGLRAGNLGTGTDAYSRGWHDAHEQVFRDIESWATTIRRHTQQGGQHEPDKPSDNASAQILCRP